MNDSLYAIHTHVVLTFKLNRFSLHLIDGDHFVISLWNNLQRRVYRDIPLPFPQSNRNQTWNVVSIAPRSVSLSVATHFVAFYARQGASHISLVLISPYPALKAALHPYVRRGFVSFREYFWGRPHQHDNFQHELLDARRRVPRRIPALAKGLSGHDLPRDERVSDGEKPVSLLSPVAAVRAPERLTRRCGLRK